MKTWGYTWKSSDGVRHEGELQAPSRDEAFAALRAQGIRAIRVFEQGGRGVVRKRLLWGVAAAVPVLAFAFGAYVALRPRPGEPPARGGDGPRASVKPARQALETAVVELAPGVRVATPRPRMHVEPSAVTNLGEMFRFESERFLARFASPGAEVPAGLQTVPDDLYDALEADILIRPEDSKAVVDLKRIVAGLKEDARRHLSVGANLRDWTEFLIGRQKMESQYRERIIGNFADDKEEMHRHLRALGFE